MQVGLSDHTPGLGVSIASIAYGATLVEKHVTVARTGDGIDSAFSLTPRELATVVAECERAWQSLGTSRIGPTDAEREGLRFRRSLHVVAGVRAGDTVSRGNVRSIRPAGGLPPVEIDRVLGAPIHSERCEEHRAGLVTPLGRRNNRTTVQCPPA